MRRYLPLVKCLAVLDVVFGAGMFAIDCAVGMPRWWIVCEGPPLIAPGGTMFWLAAETQRRIAEAEGSV